MTISPGWQTVHTRYTQVKFQSHKTVKCSNCGRTLRRQRTFTQTINPFNKNPDGSIKTFVEILAELRIEAADWQTTSEVCTRCKETDRAF